MCSLRCMTPSLIIFMHCLLIKWSPLLQDKTVTALKTAHGQTGSLKLSHLKRVKQLGTGDVGLVDLVELTNGGHKYVHSSTCLHAWISVALVILSWRADDTAYIRSFPATISVCEILTTRHRMQSLAISVPLLQVQKVLWSTAPNNWATRRHLSCCSQEPVLTSDLRYTHIRGAPFESIIWLETETLRYSCHGLSFRFAMKTLEKEEMMERNKIMRVLTEEQILQTVDHPFLASLAGTIETNTHLHFLMEYCEGGELYAHLTSRPMKRFKESHMRFYCSEVSTFFLFHQDVFMEAINGCYHRTQVLRCI